MTARILLIEDDPDIALAVREVLRRGGYEVVGADTGRQGLRAFHTERPACVLLDVGLPELDGWTVLERIRDISEVPVLLLTAHGRETEKVRGLRAGADDYLTKPFGTAELLARVEALLRRCAAPEATAEVYADARLEVRFAAREVFVQGAPVTLTPTEFRLLTFLVRHPGQALSAGQLLESAWRDPLQTGPERVKFAVMRLRRKLGPADGDDHPIEAVRGFGYRYVPDRGAAGGDQPAAGPAAARRPAPDSQS